MEKKNLLDEIEMNFNTVHKVPVTCNTWQICFVLAMTLTWDA